jgi:hypothetical protein
MAEIFLLNFLIYSKKNEKNRFRYLFKLLTMNNNLNVKDINNFFNVLQLPRDMIKCVVTEDEKLLKEGNLTDKNVEIAHAYCISKHGTVFFFRKLRVAGKVYHILKKSVKLEKFFKFFHKHPKIKDFIEKGYEKFKNSPLEKYIEKKIISYLNKFVIKNFNKEMVNIETKMYDRESVDKHFNWLDKLIKAEKWIDTVIDNLSEKIDLYINKTRDNDTNTDYCIDLDSILNEPQTCPYLYDDNVEVVAEEVTNEKNVDMVNISETNVKMLNGINDIISILKNHKNLSLIAFDRIIDSSNLNGWEKSLLKSLIHHHKMHFMDVVDILGTVFTDLPVQSFHNLINDFKYGESNIKIAIDSGNFILDAMALINPTYAGVALIYSVVMNGLEFLNDLRTHLEVMKINEVQFRCELKLSFAHFHKSWTCDIDNDLFDVHVHTRGNHCDNARNSGRKMAEKQLREHFFTKALIPYRTYVEGGKYEYFYDLVKNNVYATEAMNANFDLMLENGEITYEEYLAIQDYYHTGHRTIFEDFYNKIFHIGYEKFNAEKFFKTHNFNNYVGTRAIEKHYDNYFYGSNQVMNKLHTMAHLELNFVKDILGTDFIAGSAMNAGEIILVNTLTYIDKEIKYAKKNPMKYLKEKLKSVAETFGWVYLRSIIYKQVQLMLKLCLKTGTAMAGATTAGIGFILSSATNAIRATINFAKKGGSVGKFTFQLGFAIVEIATFALLQAFLPTIAIFATCTYLVGLVIVAVALIFSLVYRLAMYLMRDIESKLQMRNRYTSMSDRYLFVNKSNRFLLLDKSDRMSFKEKNDRMAFKGKSMRNKVGKSIRYLYMSFIDNSEIGIKQEKKTRYDKLERYKTLNRYKNLGKYLI